MKKVYLVVVIILIITACTNTESYQTNEVLITSTKDTTISTSISTHTPVKPQIIPTKITSKVNGKIFFIVTGGSSAKYKEKVVMIDLQTKEETTLFESDNIIYPLDRSPDYRFIAFDLWKSYDEQGWPDIYIYDVQQNKIIPLATEEESYDYDPVFSPDSRMIAFVSNFDIYLYDLYEHIYRQLTFTEGHAVNPVWSPDGASIFYLSEGNINLIEINSGENTAIMNYRENSLEIYNFIVSPNGDKIAFSSVPRPMFTIKQGNIFIYDLVLGVLTNLYETDKTYQFNPLFTWSRDGSSIIFNDPNNGLNEIYKIDIESKEVEQLPPYNAVKSDDIWSYHILDIVDDGKFILCEVFQPHLPNAIFIINLQTNDLIELFRNPAHSKPIIWIFDFY